MNLYGSRQIVACDGIDFAQRMRTCWLAAARIHLRSSVAFKGQTNGALLSQSCTAAHLQRWSSSKRACDCRGSVSRFGSSVHCQASSSAESGGDAVATLPPPPPALTGAEIREKFLKFFEEKGHTRLPSSSLVPDDPTVLLTIAGMLQFKPIFLGQVCRSVPCATTSQKCVRTNDIENVGVTARHHTFFEMLGNFSFGDYFKKKAIEMAWELTTQVFRVPADRVWVSVFEEDDEAYCIWKDDIGVPEERIKRMGEADNFWASGPTGPCGPCSELYYDFHPSRGTEGADLEDDSRFIEFYNLVFMESNRSADRSLSPLAAKNIDTGMGLERMAQILQGVPNNYETDLIFPMIHKAAQIAGVDYHTAPDNTKRDLKVIGDHIRAVTYLISDGVTPSNVGRGYVLRRLLRRVVMKGQLLGIREPFTPSVAAVAVGLSGGCDPAVAANAPRIYDELEREESKFVSTLEAGQKILEEILQRAASEDGAPIICGDDAFLLYDTFGFPLEITQEIAADRGAQVDVDGFERAMSAQRTRSKEALKVVDLTAGAALAQLATQVGSTEFLGYTDLLCESGVVGIMRDGMAVESSSAGGSVDIILDRTPFYAESGGQIGDKGLLKSASGNGADNGALITVMDVQKAAGGGVSVHKAEVLSGEVRVGDKVIAEVDEKQRQRARCNHTATHLLQAALKAVLGEQTSQQGSLVEFDRLRFDFNLPRPMTDEEVTRVETLVNSWIHKGHPLNTKVMSLQDAKAAGAVAMFGEKYSDVVRVVDVPGVSMELCGGTHVASTAEIGGFKVLSESGIASGVRRIEAVSGPALVEYLNSVDAVVKDLCALMKVKPQELSNRVVGLMDEVKSSAKQVSELKSALALAKSASLAQTAAATPSGALIIVERLDGVDAKALQEAAANLQGQLGVNSAVVLGGSPGEGKVSLVTAFGEQVVKGGLQAGKFVGSIAKICGGGGGGRPNIAQAGGKDPSKIDEALDSARKQLLEALS